MSNKAHGSVSPRFPRHPPSASRVVAEKTLFEEMEAAAVLLQSEEDFGRAGVRRALAACHSFLHVRGLSGQALKPLSDLIRAFEAIGEPSPGPSSTIRRRPRTLPELFDPKARPGRRRNEKWSRSPAARDTKTQAAAMMDGLMKSGISKETACRQVARAASKWPRISDGVIKPSTVANWRDDLMQSSTGDPDRLMFEAYSQMFCDGPKAASHLKQALDLGPVFSGGVRRKPEET